MSFLSMENISLSYAKKQVLNNFSYSLSSNTRLGIIGESGAGKSTILKILLGLQKNYSGSYFWNNNEFKNLSSAELRYFRSNVQAVFQDPVASLNPRLRVKNLILEPLRSLKLVPSSQYNSLLQDALKSVSLDYELAFRYPHELSGGQKQRVAVARAIITKPKLLLADEPVSALDMATRFSVTKLLAALIEQQNMALIMVSHDISVIAALCNEIIVMKDGVIVELGSVRNVLETPKTDYAKKLLASVPKL